MCVGGGGGGGEEMGYQFVTPDEDIYVGKLFCWIAHFSS